MKYLNALLCFVVLSFVSSQAAIIEIAPANARMTTMILGGQTVAGGNGTSINNCVAQWNFEDGALTTDSTGGNTLSNVGTATADTGNFMQGSASTDLEEDSTQRYTISDSNLDVGFPLKDGDTTKIISVAAWFRIESLPSNGAGLTIWSKWNSASGSYRSFLLVVYNDTTDTSVRLYLGYNSGADGESIDHGSALSINTWYHVTATYDNSDKGYTVRLDDAAGDTIGTDLDSTATLDGNKLTVTADADVKVGAFQADGTWSWDGQIDEVLIFSDVLTGPESEAISKGTFTLD